MKKWITLMSLMLIGCVSVFAALDPPVEPPSDDSTDLSQGLRKQFSDRPFFGTESVLTLNGSYVNSPKEDYEQIGVWTLPLSLDELHGVIAELSFGDAARQGQWQLTYRYKLVTGDSEWAAIADSNGGISLSDRRSQVLKASYNIRDWWKVGVAAVVEDRYGSEPTVDTGAFGLTSGESVGFQIDTLLKF